MVFAVVLLCMDSLLVPYRVLDALRFLVAGQPSADRPDGRHKMWDKETEEAENDIAGLSMSFQTVQVFRCYPVGVLPTKMGLEEPQHEHPMSSVWSLVGASLASALATLALLALTAERKKTAAKRSPVGRDEWP